ncbi:TetR/AcrR family transcriptional regulator [Nonomuraea deserti]|uniref:TetR/AcrR family transcriptional regulator n=1 Tax=Nonomuraea deserti TaxID=1848322 RepID=A0A4R4W9X8_9ACTN|nr:helix-turn-helix domain-containing protein [Nonomuraea deserti]TDD12055.1 TetR/AcrR family transcriptional regulator [Nonomuraea deserti]
MSAHTSRRQSLRQADSEEIHTAARKLLVEQGSAAVTTNAVARQVGMSGAALYHYYASHDELVGAVTAGFFRDLAAAMERARDAHAGAPRGGMTPVPRPRRTPPVPGRPQDGGLTPRAA